MSTGRRGFLKGVASGVAVAGSAGSAVEPSKPPAAGPLRERIRYPRTFSGRNLEMIAFPLGGIGTGSISLGGRGQFRDWEIFNRPGKGVTLPYTFFAIWAQAPG